jgi:type III secretion protein J
MHRSQTLPLLLALAACARAELVHGVDEAQANQVLVALDEGGVRAEKRREEGVDGAWRVDVEASDASRAHRILADRELPRVRPAGFGEVFGKGSVVPTPSEERALYLHALSGELARTVEAIDGVLEARVHLALPPQDPLRPDPGPPTRAAVLVKARAGARARLDPLEGGIRSLVAGAVPGLDTAHVAIVIAEAAAAPPPAQRAARTGRAVLRPRRQPPRWRSRSPQRPCGIASRSRSGRGRAAELVRDRGRPQARRARGGARARALRRAGGSPRRIARGRRRRSGPAGAAPASRAHRRPRPRARRRGGAERSRGRRSRAAAPPPRSPRAGSRGLGAPSALKARYQRSMAAAGPAPPLPRPTGEGRGEGLSVALPPLLDHGSEGCATDGGPRGGPLFRCDPSDLALCSAVRAWHAPCSRLLP